MCVGILHARDVLVLVFVLRMIAAYDHFKKVTRIAEPLKSGSFVKQIERIKYAWLITYLTTFASSEPSAGAGAESWASLKPCQNHDGTGSVHR